LPAPYTDPQTRLHFASAEEFAEIRRLPSDIIQGTIMACALKKEDTGI
jgi:INO80 complex subunit C